MYLFSVSWWRQIDRVTRHFYVIHMKMTVVLVAYDIYYFGKEASGEQLQVKKPD